MPNNTASGKEGLLATIATRYAENWSLGDEPKTVTAIQTLAKDPTVRALAYQEKHLIKRSVRALLRGDEPTSDRLVDQASEVCLRMIDHVDKKYNPDGFGDVTRTAQAAADFITNRQVVKITRGITK